MSCGSVRPLTDMAEAQLARTMRGARYRPEELEESLQNLVQQAPLQEVTLWNGAGERWKHRRAGKRGSPEPASSAK
ncbi:MAG: hypothetical protein R3F17_02750 [Planctomycetota bacterium]